MSGQFSVDPGYWEWGYCDYQPAGPGGGRRRNRVKLHGQEWDVTDLELEYILSRLVQEPAPLAVKPKQKRRQAPRQVQVPDSYVPDAPIKRFNADNFILLRNEAERNADAAILAALSRLVMQIDDEDVETLLVLM